MVEAKLTEKEFLSARYMRVAHIRSLITAGVLDTGLNAQRRVA